MTLDEFLKSPSTAIVLESKEDFKFLQKEFCKRDIRWCNDVPFSASFPYLEKTNSYPVYITSGIAWGFCSDMFFEKIAIKIDLNSIDDFYDERLTIQEFINTEEKLAIRIKNDQEALKLLDRLQLLGVKYASGDPYLTKENKFKDLSHNKGDQCCYSNKGTYGSKSHLENYEGKKVYEFEDINFNITFTDFFKKPKSSYYFEGVRVVNLRTEDEMNKFIEAMKSYGMTPSTLNGFKQYGDQLCFTNIGTYGDVDCYRNQKEVNGDNNITFAPIYTFDEIIFD